MLEIQLDISIFLADMADHIAGNAGSRVNTQWLEYTPSRVETANSLAMWPCPTSTSPTYSPPTAFDATALLRLAETQLNHASDEIWLCQTDPWYMKRDIRERNMLTKAPNDWTWEQLAATFVDKNYARLSMWRTIAELCKEVCTAVENVRPSVGQRLPEKGDLALLALTKKLHGYMQSQTYALDTSATRAALREWNTACRDVVNIFFGHHESIDPEYHIGRLANAVTVLQETLQASRSHDHHAINVLLSETMSKLEDPRIACRVDRRLYDHIADLAILNEMSASCRYNQMGQFVPSAQFESTKTELNCPRVTAESKQIVKDMGMLLRTFYNTPLPCGRKNLAWWEVVQNSRLQLAIFWTMGRKKLDMLKATDSEVQQAVVNWFSFDTSTSFLDDLDEERKKCEAVTSSDARNRSDDKENAVFEDLVTPWLGLDEQVQPVRRKKTKAKARREAPARSLPFQSADSRTTSALTHVKLPAIPVNEESRAVLTKIYSATVETGEVKWQRFMRTMVDAGCTAREAVGSAVTFSFGAGCVSVHKKHPDPTVDAIMLHAIGRRMRKWFGWSEERFVLR